MTEQERARRNLNPTKEAVAAKWLWGREYSEQDGGSMDFWNRLELSRKRVCREMVGKILEAKDRSVVRG